MIHYIVGAILVVFSAFLQLEAGAVSAKGFTFEDESQRMKAQWITFAIYVVSLASFLIALVVLT